MFYGNKNKIRKYNKLRVSHAYKSDYKFKYSYITTKLAVNGALSWNLNYVIVKFHKKKLYMQIKKNSCARTKMRINLVIDLWRGRNYNFKCVVFGLEVRLLIIIFIAFGIVQSWDWNQSVLEYSSISNNIGNNWNYLINN